MNDDTTHQPTTDQHSICLALADEAATQACATRLAQACCFGVVHLQGGLGAGKTTLTRHWLQALGHTGAVKSPTYTLVEPYQIAGRAVYHFDLYRLDDPYELELMGVRDYLDQPDALLLIEWPSKGDPVLPKADIDLHLQATDPQHEYARTLTLTACSVHGIAILRQFNLLSDESAHVD